MNPQTLIGTLLLLALAGARPAHAEWVNRVADGIMGTRITVELWSEDKEKADHAIDAVLDEFRRLDESMSTYKPSSEVSNNSLLMCIGPSAALAFTRETSLVGL